MSTQLSLPDNWLPQRGLSAMRQRADERDIALRVNINADTRRIFNALTVPEYCEAWICPPTPHPNSYIAASQSKDRYDIDFYCGNALHASITGIYRIFRQRKLLFTWHNRISPTSNESLVKIQLEGNFSQTFLNLSHWGVTSAEESQWLRAMWSASFTKLASLF